jgi:F-type H+-transporting ATPase subunit gamma
MAGESIRDLKRRIRSVQSTRQITRAMEMVAAAKLRRAQNRLFAARPYAAKMRDMLANLAAAATDLDHPLLANPHAPEPSRIGMILLTADRGLAGSHNANIFRASEIRLRRMGADTMRLLLVGKKGVDYFRRRRYPITQRYPGVMGGLSVETAEQIARAATDLFLSGEVQQVELLYTTYISTMSYRVTWEQLLPIAPPAQAGAEREGTRTDYIFEPNPETILAALLPRYISMRIFIAMAEAQTAEQGSRMISMGSATKNASELIDQLVLRRNRARQAAITKELAEIVGGAEALK